MLPLTRWLSTVLLFSMLALCLSACGTTPEKVTTRIDPSSVHADDHFASNGPGDASHTVLTVTSPAPAAPLTPATAPGTVTVRDTPASPPVHVELPNGRSVTVPAGSTLSVDVTESHQAPASVHDRSVDSVGATLRTNGDKGDFTGSAPAASLPAGTDQGVNGTGTTGGGASGTGSQVSSDWERVASAIASASSRVSFWLAAFGVLCWIAAVVMVIFEHVFGGKTDWALVVILFAAGLLSIGFAFIADAHPWIIVVLALLLAVGIAGYVLWWKFGQAAPVVAAETDAKALLAKVEALFKAPASAAPTSKPGTVTSVAE